MALWYQGNSCLSRGWNVKRWHSGTKTNHIVADHDQMLDAGFVAKASSLKPMPIMARIDGRNVSWVEKEARHSFMSPKLTKELGFADA